MSSRTPTILLATTLTLLAGATTTAGTVYEPIPYVSQDDSPFRALIDTPGFHLETFEDTLLNTPGVEASAGQVFGPSSQTNSVDLDDGVADGSGAAGHSYWSGYPNPTGVTFSFDAEALGSLPTHAGIVFTTSVYTTTITFLDAAGEPIATYDLNDGVPTQTAGDRFVGVIHDEGIAAITVSDSGSAFQVDHLQYGFAHCPEDLDEDGVVNVLDLIDLLMCYGQTANPPCDRSDLNGDNTTDFLDLIDLLMAFGTICP